MTRKAGYHFGTIARAEAPRCMFAVAPRLGLCTWRALVVLRPALVGRCVRGAGHHGRGNAEAPAMRVIWQGIMDAVWVSDGVRRIWRPPFCGAGSTPMGRMGTGCGAHRPRSPGRFPERALGRRSKRDASPTCCGGIAAIVSAGASLTPSMRRVWVPIADIARSRMACHSLSAIAPP